MQFVMFILHKLQKKKKKKKKKKEKEKQKKKQKVSVIHSVYFVTEQPLCHFISMNLVRIIISCVQKNIIALG